MNQMNQIYKNNVDIYFESDYADALHKLIFKAENNKWEGNRTERKTVSIHSAFMLPFVEDNFPLIKCKSVNPKLQLVETLWILLGRNDLKWLNDRGLHYWDDWSLSENGRFPVGNYFNKKEYDVTGAIDTIGYSYGTAARYFTGRTELIDNWTEVIKTALKDPSSRRLVFSLWDPNNVDKTPLPPCVITYIFKTSEIQTTETGTMYNVDIDAIMRSNDAFLGAPYDFMMASWILKIFCLQLNTIKGKNIFIARHVFYTASNFHIYENQVEPVKEYLDRVNEDLKLKNSIIKTGEVNVNIEFKNKDNIKFDTDIEIANFIQMLSDQCDESNYNNVIVEKNYDKKYGQIKCEVTI